MRYILGMAQVHGPWHKTVVYATDLYISRMPYQSIINENIRRIKII